jgi:hypothetical protein
MSYKSLLPKSINSKNTLLLLGAAILLIAGKYIHEPWRDEWHAWMLVQQANSFAELFQYKIYEGHPHAYFIILYLVKHVSNTSFAFYTIHFLPAVLCYYFLFFKFNFTHLQKIFLLGNYYFLFEFGIINRVYIWVILFSLLIIICIQNKQLYTSFFFIAWLPLLHLQAIPIAIFFAGILLLQLLHTKQSNTKNIIAISCTLVISIAIGLWQASTPVDALHHLPLQKINWLYLLPVSFAYQLKAILPIPIFNSLHCWNTFLLDIPFVILFIIAIVFIYLFIKNWIWQKKILFILAALLSLFLLAYINGWAIRHFSFFWLLLFFGFCLQSVKTKVANILFTVILAVQCIAGGILFYKDVKYPFSASQSAAKVISIQKDKSYLIGAHHYTIEPISFYLQQPIYHLGVCKVVYAMQWKEENMESDVTIAQIDSVIKNHKQIVCILSKAFSDSIRYQLMNDTVATYNSQLLFTTAQSIVNDECYEIWKLNAKLK